MAANEGISVTGGQLTIHGPTAVGPKAHAEAQYGSTSAPENLDELRAEIDRLLEAVTACEAEIDGANAVLGSARRASAEARKPQPDKRSLIETLGHVAAGVGSLTGLANAAHALQTAVGLIL